MTPTQVFNWFCKEQNVMPLIREIYYKSNPQKHFYNGSTISSKPMTYTEYIENLVTQYGFDTMFRHYIDDYFWKVGWNLYDGSLKNKIDNLTKKWNYFVRNNIFFTNIKIGDDIKYVFRNWTNNGIDEVTNDGIITNINMSYLTIEIKDKENDGILVTIYPNSFKNNNIELDFYIKRNRREYYGSNRK